MKKINSNSGVTLAMLIVLIIVMLILLGLVLNFTTKPIQNSIDTQYKSELLIIQHTLYEKYKEAEAKGNSSILLGEKIVKENVEGENYPLFKDFPEFLEMYAVVFDDGNKKTIETPENKNGYYLLKESHMNELGLTGERIKEDQYIVNYETGEVYNNTKKVYSDKSPVYLPGYGKEEYTGKSTSEMIQIP